LRYKTSDIVKVPVAEYKTSDIVKVPVAEEIEESK
jgi:hypothetical protein